MHFKHELVQKVMLLRMIKIVSYKRQLQGQMH